MKLIKNVIDTGLTCEEIETLKEADEILHRMQITFGEQLDMTSLESGEVISTNEFARVRGILGGLTEYRVWQLSINERVD